MTITAETSAKELAEASKQLSIERGQSVRYAYYSTGTAAGVWDEEGRRWVAVVEKTIIPSCPWVRSEKEYLINGEPAYRQDLWIEV